MTEAEWLACNNPREMLAFLRGRASNRKLRLFACGFCRGIVDVINDKDCRNAVLVAEQFADGIIGQQALEAACQMARLVWAASEWKGMLAAEAAEMDAWRSASGIQSALEMDDIPHKFWKRQSDILRDIFGPLPFRLVQIDRQILAWNDDCIRKLAYAVYEERAFDRLPVFADALEEAGCDNADILAHCRQPGEHVRGCWVVDLILGKE